MRDGLARLSALDAAFWRLKPAYLLSLEVVGILAPLVLLPARLFNGAHNAPTLKDQYVLKDIADAGVCCHLIV